MGIAPKKKKCKAIGKAIGTDVTGCETETYYRTYGLCQNCHKEWLKTPEGKESQLPKCKTCRDPFEPIMNNNNQKHCLEKDECIAACVEYSKVQKDKQDKKDFQDRKTGAYTKENKKALQSEINKLARMIDNKFGYGCISCGTQRDVQYAGGHRFSVGSNASIRYNLHDVHKQCNKRCNEQLSGNPAEYDKGLVSRHGLEYKDLVHGLGLKYPYIGLKSNDYPEKLKIIRKFIREFDTFVLNDAIQARTMFNNLIGIYVLPRIKEE